MSERGAVTQLLGDWRSGDRDALDKLMPLVYDELRRLARRYLGTERPDHTLQATGLVNEAFIRLADSDISWQDRAHFFAVAARMMRRILIDYEKARKSQKRGGLLKQTVLDENTLADKRPPPDIIDIDSAITKLAGLDELKSDLIVLHYFGGLGYEEMGEVKGISAATVDRHLRLGKAWLLHEITDA
jgi:RNA polymerase sigma factor (TIGR02999 family)